MSWQKQNNAQIFEGEKRQSSEKQRNVLCGMPSSPGDAPYGASTAPGGGSCWCWCCCLSLPPGRGGAPVEGSNTKNALSRQGNVSLNTKEKKALLAEGESSKSVFILMKCPLPSPSTPTPNLFDCCSPLPFQPRLTKRVERGVPP